MADDARRYTLIAADGKTYSRPQKGTVGAHRGSKWRLSLLVFSLTSRPPSAGGHTASRAKASSLAESRRAGRR